MQNIILNISKNKQLSKKTGQIAFSLFRLAFLLAIGYIILFPLIYMMSNAFKPEAQILDPSVVWVPKSFTFDNVVKAFYALDYLTSLSVSLLVNVVSALIQVFTCAIVAYGLSRFKFKESKLIFGLIVLTILVPPQAIIIPLYVNFAHFDVFGILTLLTKLFGADLRPNLLNSPLAFYLPSVFGVGLRSGLFIFIYRQFFSSIPKELEEAAWVDGAGPVKTFLRIVLPSSGVAILVVTILSIIWYWNEFYLGSLFFTDQFPLAVALAQIRSGLQNTMGYNQFANPLLIRNILMAACLIFMLPMLVMYAVLQKYFIRSINRVGIIG